MHTPTLGTKKRKQKKKDSQNTEAQNESSLGWEEGSHRKDKTRK